MTMPSIFANRDHTAHARLCARYAGTGGFDASVLCTCGVDGEKPPCAHEIQKHVGLVSWCQRCGALRLGPADWRVPDLAATRIP